MFQGQKIINNKLYSLDLTEEEWKEIVCLVWLEHDFDLADKIQNKLIEKYKDIDFSSIGYTGGM